jgi:hypothetical protein
MLLQRLESKQPGLVESLLDGAKADREGVRAQENEQCEALSVFDEAISILELIRQQNQAAA